MAAALASYTNGQLTAPESELVDYKEEPGRRTGRQIEPGKPVNHHAAECLADDVACFANTPGGGAIIVGIEDKTLNVIGTELDTDWLRHRIYELIDLAPYADEHTTTDGQRLIVLTAPESPEPIADLKGRIRWRVGDHCVPVDRAAWWEHRSAARGEDLMAAASNATADRATSGALRLARATMGADTDVTDEDLLRRIGALRSDSYLTSAAELILCPKDSPGLELAVIDVSGGEVVSQVQGGPGQSLLEQIETIETAIRVLNESYRDTTIFAGKSSTQIPTTAIREAVVNGLTHRDWNTSEPTQMQWFTVDATFTVRSPGPFTGGVTSENILSNRHARYPAVADLFRALGYVEKQGLGIDRMYQSMISLGHRPPVIEQVAGPSVTCTLVGGPPIRRIVEMMSNLRPVPRAQDVRVAVVLDHLWRKPFVTLERAAEVLQCSVEHAKVALAVCSQTTYGGVPVIERFGEAWVLAGPVREEIMAAASTNPEEGFVPHLLGANDFQRAHVARLWVAAFGSISTKELADLCLVSAKVASRAIESLIDEGALQKVGGGRSTRYRPT